MSIEATQPATQRQSLVTGLLICVGAAILLLAVLSALAFWRARTLLHEAKDAHRDFRLETAVAKLDAADNWFFYADEIRLTRAEVLFADRPEAAQQNLNAFLRDKSAAELQERELILLIDLSLYRGMFATSAQARALLRERNPVSVNMLVYDAWEAALQDQPKLALQQLANALRIDPDNTLALLLKGQIQLSRDAPIQQILGRNALLQAAQSDTIFGLAAATHLAQSMRPVITRAHFTQLAERLRSHPLNTAMSQDLANEIDPVRAANVSNSG